MSTIVTIVIKKMFKILFSVWFSTLVVFGLYQSLNQVGMSQSIYQFCLSRSTNQFGVSKSINRFGVTQSISQLVSDYFQINVPLSSNIDRIQVRVG